MQNNLPIACSLTDSELQQRRREVLLKAKTAITGAKELEHGFSYQFSSTPERIAELATLVALEHQCCPFLKFCLVVEPGDGSIFLELTGPEGTKAFLTSLFE
jgi:hypothetical protein